MPTVVIPQSFKRRLKDKPQDLQNAIAECVARLGENPRHPSLKTHIVQARAPRCSRHTLTWRIA